MEFDFGMTLLRQPQIVRRGEQIGEGIHTIERELGLVLGHEFAHGRFVIATDPARTGVALPHEPSLHAVFRFQAMLHHFKLQLPNRAQQHVAACMRAKHLNRAFLAQLQQALL